MLYVGHAIDFKIALNCIACPDDHLLVKCSLWSFSNNYSCLIKFCFMFTFQLVSDDITMCADHYRQPYKGCRPPLLTSAVSDFFII